MAVTSKIKQVNSKSELQASRFKPAPPKLAELIALVNIVPPDFDLPDMSHVMDDHPLTAGGRILLALGELKKSLPSLFWICVMLGKEKALEIILDKPREPSAEDDVDSEDDSYFGSDCDEEDENDSGRDSAYLAFYRYRELRDCREKLRCLARIASKWKPEQSAYFDFHIDRKDRETLTTSNQLSIDSNRLVYIKKNYFEAAVNGVDATRIRECEVCKCIFWAGRKTQKGCSARCGDVIRKRRYRARQSEYEYRRYKKEEDKKKGK